MLLSKTQHLAKLQIKEVYTSNGIVAQHPKFPEAVAEAKIKLDGLFHDGKREENRVQTYALFLGHSIAIFHGVMNDGMEKGAMFAHAIDKMDEIRGGEKEGWYATRDAVIDGTAKAGLMERNTAFEIIDIYLAQREMDMNISEERKAKYDDYFKAAENLKLILRTVSTQFALLAPPPLSPELALRIAKK
jgi:hypothetical protein